MSVKRSRKLYAVITPTGSASYDLQVGKMNFSRKWTCLSCLPDALWLVFRHRLPCSLPDELAFSLRFMIIIENTVMCVSCYLYCQRNRRIIIIIIIDYKRNNWHKTNKIKLILQRRVKIKSSYSFLDFSKLFYLAYYDVSILVL